MDIKNFVLSYYKNSHEDFHLQKVEKAFEAKKPHTHEYFQIYYIKKGSLTHFVEGKCSKLGHSDMFIVPPYAVHYIDTEKDTVFYSFSFMPDFLSPSGRLANSFLSEVKKWQVATDNAMQPKISLNAGDVVFAETLIERMYLEFTQKPIGFAENIRSLAEILVNLLARRYFEKESTPLFFENNKDYVLHCVEFIKENCTENLTLEEMTKMSMMTKNSFCRIFHEITGFTFKEYLNCCRIEKSARLIKEGHKISAVALLCGYSDFSTFYRNFVKIMGVPPSKL